MGLWVSASTIRFWQAVTWYQKTKKVNETLTPEGVSNCSCQHLFSFLFLTVVNLLIFNSRWDTEKIHLNFANISIKISIFQKPNFNFRTNPCACVSPPTPPTLKNLWYLEQCLHVYNSIETPSLFKHWNF